MVRQRDSVLIRRDAIHMAIKKAEAGCVSCARGYLELAKQHGASEEEFRLAISNASEAIEKGMSRRSLLKLALGVAAGLTASMLGLLPGKAEADGSYWGTDTNSASCCGLPQNFYLGRLGYGTNTGDTQDFNTAAANAAGNNGTYAYWDVEGPDASPNADPYSWGLQQGQTAAGEWSNNPNANYVGGSTIFGDVESGNPGWGSGDQSRNQAVLQGFLDGIQNGSNGTPLTPGIYITPSNWQTFFGAGYATNQNFVLWITGCQTCVVSCRPCDSCTETPAQVQNLLSTISQNSLGGSGVVVWQYWIGECGCGDFDVATQDPSAGFTPVAGPVYQCLGCGVGGCS
ncbi:MAG: hypothetical protein NVSMB27_41270 [Ktedonobacteraceae bacterium]